MVKNWLSVFGILTKMTKIFEILRPQLICWNWLDYNSGTDLEVQEAWIDVWQLVILHIECWGTEFIFRRIIVEPRDPRTRTNWCSNWVVRCSWKFSDLTTTTRKGPHGTSTSINKIRKISHRPRPVRESSGVWIPDCAVNKNPRMVL